MLSPRVLAALTLSAACGPGPEPAAPRPAPVPTAPLANEAAPRACAAAAAGLDRGTRGLRDPEESLLGPMQARCEADGWPPAAIDCFARMTEADFGRCAALLPARARERMFDRVGGGSRDRISLAVTLAKLSALKVGIAECDEFIAVVSRVLVCEQMPLEVRAQLAAETADFWALPTTGLPADAQQRMAGVCGRSSAELAQRAASAGCAP